MASRVDHGILPLYRRDALRRPSPVARLGRYFGLIVLGAFYGLMLAILPPQLMVIPALPILVMAGAVLWLMPDIASYPERLLDRMMTLFVVLVLIWPSYIALNLPGLPWISFGRLALGVLALVFLYALASSAALRDGITRVTSVNRPLMWCVIAYAAMQFITVPISESITNSLTQAINNQLYFTLMFFFGCWYFSKPGRVVRLSTLLLISTAFICLLCVPEKAREELLWANSIPSFLQVDPVLLDRILGSQARMTDGLYRVRGTFSLSLVLAEFVSLVLPLLLHRIVVARTVAARFGLLALWVLVALVVLWSNSRLGAIGFVLAHVGYTFIWGMRRWRTNATSIIGPGLVLMFPAMMAAMLGVILSSNTLTTRLLGGHQHQNSNDARATQWDMAIPHVLTNPVGHGGGQSGNTLQYFNAGGAMTVDSHYITTLLDFGVIGFVGLFGMVLYASWQGYRLHQRTADPEVAYAGPLAVSLFIFFVIKSVLSQEDNHVWAFVFVAAIAALRARELGVMKARPPSRADAAAATPVTAA